MFGILKKNGKNDRYVLAEQDENSLGNILVEMGFVTQAQLDEAVRIQKQKAPKIGEILVEMKILTEQQLEEAILYQRVRRGEASVAEETKFHGKRKRRLLKEVTSELKQAAELSQVVTAKITNGKTT